MKLLLFLQEFSRHSKQECRTVRELPIISLQNLSVYHNPNACAKHVSLVIFISLKSSIPSLLNKMNITNVAMEYFGKAAIQILHILKMLFLLSLLFIISFINHILLYSETLGG